MRRQSDPELKTAGPAPPPGAAAVPHAGPGLHPFDGASIKYASRAIRVLVGHAAFGNVGERRNA